MTINGSLLSFDVLIVNKRSEQINLYLITTVIVIIVVGGLKCLYKTVVSKSHLTIGQLSRNSLRAYR